MNISSLVVHARREDADAVRATLTAWPGVEVPAAAPDGRLVVTVESGSDREAGEAFDRIRLLPGVMSVSLVYHHFEPAGPDGPAPEAHHAHHAHGEPGPGAAAFPDACMPQEEARHER